MFDPRKKTYTVCASRTIVESTGLSLFENVEQNVMFHVVQKINFEG